ncbi:MAG: hypothetical protein L0H70_07945 [Xanthomonadales bacterium]|nr:hypothetical protein [Xanthomonadales bacterium]
MMPLSQVAFAHSSDLMDRWRAYALARITPDFDWAQTTSAPAPAPTVLDTAMRRPLAFAIDTHPDSLFALHLDLRDGAISFARTLGSYGNTSSAPLLSMLGDATFSGSVTKPGLSTHFGVDGTFGASVVLAHQRFAAPMLDGYDYPLRMPASGVAALAETSHGAGLEFRASASLLPAAKLDWYAGFRSRIAMDAFQNYRGIYGNPGDLDIPAQARLGLAWQASANTQLRAGLDRIMYSGVKPFVSSSLPRRLLAVLGEGTSPEFRWRDLNIYSATLVHQVNATDHWNLRYSTGEQPHATSALLDHVLRANAANYAVAASYTSDVGSSQWHLVANYAPAEFVLGVPGRVHSHDDEHAGRQLEFELLWTKAL